MQRFIDNRELEEMEKHQREGSPYGGKSGGFERASSESPDQKVSFADFRRQKARDQFHSSAINITYTEQVPTFFYVFKHFISKVYAYFIPLIGKCSQPSHGVL